MEPRFPCHAVVCGPDFRRLDTLVWRVVQTERRDGGPGGWVFTNARGQRRLCKTTHLRVRAASLTAVDSSFDHASCSPTGHRVVFLTVKITEQVSQLKRVSPTQLVCTQLQHTAMIMSLRASEPRRESLTNSPVAVHEELSDDEKKRLDYLTVEKYQWPTVTNGAKIKTITDEERKARHREVQRRFMERKLNNLLTMRSEVKRLEQRYSLLAMHQEMARLQLENEELRWKLQNSREHTSADFGDVKLHGCDLMPGPVDTTSSNLPWDQILAAVCDPV